ncbi:MAG TPA: hypothetical protein VH301_11435 [Usitatibacter sp.]|jgi:Spy/CpxP family protein refolding chaperone|nr:hypothetical protein [Usitatibacter sp.]
MTRNAIAALLVAGCVASWAGDGLAQGAEPATPGYTADKLRMEARTDKRGLVERNMELTSEEAKRFWPVYDRYQRDLERILRRQNRAMNDYIHAEASMTDANAKRIGREIVESDADEQKLRERTLGKLLSVLPARKAVRYFQIENKVRAVQRYDIAEHMALVR